MGLAEIQSSSLPISASDILGGLILLICLLPVDSPLLYTVCVE